MWKCLWYSTCCCCRFCRDIEKRFDEHGYRNRQPTPSTNFSFTPTERRAENSRECEPTNSESNQTELSLREFSEPGQPIKLTLAAASHDSLEPQISSIDLELSEISSTSYYGDDEDGDSAANVSALHGYVANGLKEEERLRVINSENQDWRKLPSLNIGQYVPGYNVASHENPIEHEMWYFGGIGTSEANNLLLQRGNVIGTFLVRDNTTYEGEYTLSVLFLNSITARREVGHYRIGCSSTGRHYLPTGRHFSSIPLLEYNKQNTDGLPCRLTRRYSIESEPSAASQYTRAYELSVDSSSATSAHEIVEYAQASSEDESLEYTFARDEEASAVEVVALFDHSGSEAPEISFKKGERLYVIDGSENEDWWKFQSLRTGRIGYGPANYVAPENSSEHEEWYAAGKIGTYEVKRLLIMRGYEIGTFVIHESVLREGKYVLSMVALDKDTGKKNVKHYPIYCSPENRYCIGGDKKFVNIRQLVEHYKNTDDFLPCRLQRPFRTEFKPFTASLAKDVFEVERSSISLVRNIGRGNFGEVLLGLWKGSLEVAVKRLARDTMSSEEFLNEAELMKQLRHDNLLRLLAVVSEQPIYIVTEYMPNGSLLDYLRTGEGQNSDTEDHTDMAKQIASGMHYLETMNYIHRDLRAANVLVGRRGTYKIADFGLARLIKDDEYQASSGSKFPVKWSAPECLTRHKFSIQSDVWSYGILLYEIVTRGRIPYAGITDQELLIERLEGGYRMPQPDGCPVQFYGIMLDCWDKEPTERPSFGELQAYFSDLQT